MSQGTSGPAWRHSKTSCELWSIAVELRAVGERTRLELRGPIMIARCSYRCRSMEIVLIQLCMSASQRWRMGSCDDGRDDTEDTMITMRVDSTRKTINQR